MKSTFTAIHSNNNNNNNNNNEKTITGIPKPLKNTQFQNYLDKNAAYWRVWKTGNMCLILIVVKFYICIMIILILTTL
jgi:hypothetical protein